MPGQDEETTMAWEACVVREVVAIVGMACQDLAGTVRIEAKARG
jgi:hypothetical protein